MPTGGVCIGKFFIFSLTIEKIGILG